MESDVPDDGSKGIRLNFTQNVKHLVTHYIRISNYELRCFFVSNQIKHTKIHSHKSYTINHPNIYKQTKRTIRLYTARFYLLWGVHVIIEMSRCASHYRNVQVCMSL